MSAALEAHFCLMALARATHSIRSVAGWQYPVSDQDFAKWDSEEREKRRIQARRALQRIAPRVEADKAFA